MKHTLSNRERAVTQAMQSKRMLPFRIHYIYAHKATPDFWETGISSTMARPNNLIRKGATVEVLK